MTDSATNSDSGPAAGGPPWWLWPGCAALAALWFCWPTLMALSRVYRTDGNFSHGFLVPVLVGYAIWHRRDRIGAARPGGLHRVGGFPLLFGVSLVVFARWYEVSLLPRGLNAVFLSGWGLLIATVGLCWFLLGPSRIRQLAFSLFFLVMAIPVPSFLLNRVTLPLQRLSAIVSAGVLGILGTEVTRNGNILHLAQGSLGVAEACSGIRSLVVLSAVALTASLIHRLRKVLIVIVLLSVLPITVFSNSIRVVVSALLYDHGMEHLTHGGPHELLGMITFAIGVALLVLVASLCARLQRYAEASARQGVDGEESSSSAPLEGRCPQRPESESSSVPLEGRCPQRPESADAGDSAARAEDPKGTDVPPPVTRTQRFAIELTSPEAFTRSPGLRSRRMVFVAVVFAVGALASTLLNIHYDRLFLAAKKTLSQRKELAALPRDLGLYRLEESLALEEDEREMLAPTEEHLAAYRGPDGRLFTLTLLYWEPPYGRPSERPDLLRRPHTPDECYPAAGWTRVPGYTQDRQFDIFPGEFGSIRVYRRKDEVQIMAFWLGLAFKRTLAPDQLLSRLTSMVRSLSYAPAANIHTVTITTRGTGDTEGDVQAVLDFAATLYSILPDYGVGMRQPDQP